MEKQNGKSVTSLFVDSDAFVALAKEDDSNHERAVQILGELLHANVSFLTSNYVFSETITVISQRVSHKAALLFIEEMKSPNASFLIRWVDEELEVIATEIFKNQRSKNVSFVDCTNMAIMQDDKINVIFSFDKIYKKNGFQTVQDS